MDNFNEFDYDFSRNLIFTGPTGVGKTYLASSIVERFSSDKLHEKLQRFSISDAKFKQLVKSQQLCLRKPDEFSIPIDNFPLEMMLRSGVVLYDDLGVSDASEAYLRDFTFILDERIKKSLPIIFTTNLKREELKEKLNERIVSRILYNADVIVMTGEDRRTKNIRYFQYLGANNAKIAEG